MALLMDRKMQIILYVRDMADEVSFYRDVLGLSISYPKVLADYAEEMWVEFELGEGSLALHGGAAGGPNEFHQVVFWVEDISLAREKILAAGINIDQIRGLEDGALIAEGKDPEGHRFAIRTQE